MNTRTAAAHEYPAVTACCARIIALVCCLRAYAREDCSSSSSGGGDRELPRLKQKGDDKWVKPFKPKPPSPFRAAKTMYTNQRVYTRYYYTRIYVPPIRTLPFCRALRLPRCFPFPATLLERDTGSGIMYTRYQYYNKRRHKITKRIVFA